MSFSGAEKSFAHLIMARVEEYQYTSVNSRIEINYSDHMADMSGIIEHMLPVLNDEEKRFDNAIAWASHHFKHIRLFNINLWQHLVTVTGTIVREKLYENSPCTYMTDDSVITSNPKERKLFKEAMKCYQRRANNNAFEILMEMKMNVWRFNLHVPSSLKGKLYTLTECTGNEDDEQMEQVKLAIAQVGHWASSTRVLNYFHTVFGGLPSGNSLDIDGDRLEISEFPCGTNHYSLCYSILCNLAMARHSHVLDNLPDLGEFLKNFYMILDDPEAYHVDSMRLFGKPRKRPAPINEQILELCACHLYYVKPFATVFALGNFLGLPGRSQIKDSPTYQAFLSSRNSAAIEDSKVEEEDLVDPSGNNDNGDMKGTSALMCFLLQLDNKYGGDLTDEGYNRRIVKPSKKLVMEAHRRQKQLARSGGQYPKISV